MNNRFAALSENRAAVAGVNGKVLLGGDSTKGGRSNSGGSRSAGGYAVQGSGGSTGENNRSGAGSDLPAAGKVIGGQGGSTILEGWNQVLYRRSIKEGKRPVTGTIHNKTDTRRLADTTMRSRQQAKKTVSFSDSQKNKFSSDLKVPPKSWSDLVKKVVRDEGLEYVKPEMINNRRTAIIEPEEIDCADKIWANSILIYLVGKRPYYLHFRAYITRTWSLAGNFEIFSRDNGFYLVKFEKTEDCKKVLEGGPYLMDGKLIIMRKWSSNIKYDKDLLTSIPIWVRFLSLNFTYWNNKSISKISSLIGKPICMDDYTKNRRRLSFARVLIEVDATFEFDSEVFIQNPGEEPLKQKVEYEYKPPQCKNCICFGHFTDQCPITFKEKWIPKDNTESTVGKHSENIPIEICSEDEDADLILARLKKKSPYIRGLEELSNVTLSTESKNSHESYPTDSNKEVSQDLSKNDNDTNTVSKAAVKEYPKSSNSPGLLQIPTNQSKKKNSYTEEAEISKTNEGTGKVKQLESSEVVTISTGETIAEIHTSQPAESTSPEIPASTSTAVAVGLQVLAADSTRATDKGLIGSNTAVSLMHHERASEKQMILPSSSDLNNSFTPISVTSFYGTAASNSIENHTNNSFFHLQVPDDRVDLTGSASDFHSESSQSHLPFQLPTDPLVIDNQEWEDLVNKDKNVKQGKSTVLAASNKKTRSRLNISK